MRSFVSKNDIKNLLIVREKVANKLINKTKPHNTPSPIHRLDYLDLATSQHPPVSVEKKISHLIRSLKDNYYSYGLMVASKESERKIRDQKDYYSGFFALPRVPLQKMKAASSYIIWQKCVRKIYDLFDGENREKFILEILKLENKLKMHNKKPVSVDKVLETVLSEYESSSGFSTVVNIKQTDGVGGILSPAEFKKLLSDGHPINDLGTTFLLEQHGKLSHRLQFYILGNYLEKNISEFFTEEDLNILIDKLTIQYPDMLDGKTKFPVSKIISVFYRLLGSDEFNNSFDWKAYAENRAKLNMYYNKQNVPSMLNVGNIWVQLFDRYGYAGYFSVPSTFGFLQKLGCFPALPVIGEPKVKTNKHLKTILDITLPYSNTDQRLHKPK